MVRKILAGLLAAVLIACLGLTVASAPPVTSSDIESVQVVYYAKGGIPGQPPAVEPSYKLIGLELYETATYYVNPKVGTLASTAVISEVSSAFETWDVVTAGEQFSYGGTTTKTVRKLDGQNTVSWAPLASSTVAVATIWYQGTLDPAKPARVVEFDICFNSLQPWGIDPDGEGSATINAFDIQNVATHEAGHPVGLADLYKDYNSYLTMYGYTYKGETQKISLEDGDIAGAQVLYGAP